MFERFTESARSVIVRAQHEADGLGHNYLGTEHLLLGLVSDEGPPGRALRTLGLSCDQLRGKGSACSTTRHGSTPRHWR